MSLLYAALSAANYLLPLVVLALVIFSGRTRRKTRCRSVQAAQAAESVQGPPHAIDCSRLCAGQKGAVQVNFITTLEQAVFRPLWALAEGSR